MSENAPGRAAGYIRVSQERNARNGYGLDAQDTDIRRHAAYRVLELVGVYREAGVSGYERERPELERLLADAKAGKFDVVIFPSIDRAGRSVKDVIEIDCALREAGVGVVFVREGIDTSTPTGEFFRNVMASLAQLEGRIIADRLTKGRQRKAAGGGYVGGWLPYGYRHEAGAVAVIPEQADVVKRIFEWRSEGLSYREIACRLESEGAQAQRGGSWQVSTLRRIVSNRFYLGMAGFDGHPVPGQHMAIVPKGLFERAGAFNGDGA